MTAMRLAACLLAATALGGCAKPGNFEWGTYDESLYEYYRDSGNLDQLTAELERLSVAYEITSPPELGDLLTEAASPDRTTRHRAIKQAGQAFQPLDTGPAARLAPGLIAELGYLYLDAGNPQKAIALFKREKRNWPEAAYFMDVMIQVAKGPDKSTAGDVQALDAEAARLGTEQGK
ncbi:MAG: DUF4810 domain-containing protein [Phaeospirillum sp.]|nr:DUF4810 domain-containing protein [Phaeospirillum sp.]